MAEAFKHRCCGADCEYAVVVESISLWVSVKHSDAQTSGVMAKLILVGSGWRSGDDGVADSGSVDRIKYSGSVAN
jgi:hypothetical protein